jgi:hypothetical protein
MHNSFLGGDDKRGYRNVYKTPQGPNLNKRHWCCFFYCRSFVGEVFPFVLALEVAFLFRLYIFISNSNSKRRNEGEGLSLSHETSRQNNLESLSLGNGALLPFLGHRKQKCRPPTQILRFPGVPLKSRRLKFTAVVPKRTKTKRPFEHTAILTVAQLH